MYKWKSTEASEFVKKATFAMMSDDVKKKYEEMEAYLRKALLFEPDCKDPFTYACLGHSLFNLGKFSKAKKNLMIALQLNSDNHFMDDNEYMLNIVYQTLDDIASKDSKATDEPSISSCLVAIAFLIGIAIILWAVYK